MYLTVIKSSLYKCQDLIYHPLQHKYENILEAALADKKKKKNPPFFPTNESGNKRSSPASDPFPPSFDILWCKTSQVGKQEGACVQSVFTEVKPPLNTHL